MHDRNFPVFDQCKNGKLSRASKVSRMSVAGVCWPESGVYRAGRARIALEDDGGCE